MLDNFSLWLWGSSSGGFQLYGLAQRTFDHKFRRFDGIPLPRTLQPHFHSPCQARKTFLMIGSACGRAEEAVDPSKFILFKYARARHRLHPIPAAAYVFLRSTGAQIQFSNVKHEKCDVKKRNLMPGFKGTSPFSHEFDAGSHEGSDF